MAASDEKVHLLEMFQLSVDEGPCVDCFRFAAPIINADLSRAGGRWPLFAPRATALGLNSVHAFPLRLRGNVIGSLGLFSEQAVSIPPEVARVLQALGDVATIGIVQERALRQREIVSRQLQFALNSRVVLEQAKGFIAHEYNLSVDAAFDLLRNYFRRNGLRLSDVARSIVSDARLVPDLRAR